MLISVFRSAVSNCRRVLQQSTQSSFRTQFVSFIVRMYVCIYDMPQCCHGPEPYTNALFLSLWRALEYAECPYCSATTLMRASDFATSAVWMLENKFSFTTSTALFAGLFGWLAVRIITLPGLMRQPLKHLSFSLRCTALHYGEHFVPLDSDFDNENDDNYQLCMSIALHYQMLCCGMCNLFVVIAMWVGREVGSRPKCAVQTCNRKWFVFGYEILR